MGLAKLEFARQSGACDLRSEMFDRVARIACRLTRGLASLVAVWDKQGFSVFGCDGLDALAVGPQWSLHSMAGEGAQVVYVPNVRRDARLRRHPVYKSFPTLTGLIYVPLRLSKTGEGREGGIYIYDPDPRWSSSPSAGVVLVELAMLIKQLLEDAQSPQVVQPLMRIAEFAEVAAPFAAPADPAAAFLLDTLVRKVSWHSRNGLSFGTVRRWRAPIKRYQLSALQALKMAPTKPFVQTVASEIASTARTVVGDRYFNAVVSVPCGHSMTDHCFSNLLGAAVGADLDVPYIEAFERQSRRGQSHPRRNVALAPFELKAKPDGAILVIDDVATTGTHLSAAVAGLRPHARHVMAIAWVGG